MTVDKIIMTISHNPSTLSMITMLFRVPYPGSLGGHLPEVGVELALGQGHLVPGVEGRHAEVRTAAASAMRL